MRKKIKKPKTLIVMIMSFFLLTQEKFQHSNSEHCWTKKEMSKISENLEENEKSDTHLKVMRRIIKFKKDGKQKNDNVKSYQFIS